MSDVELPPADQATDDQQDEVGVNEETTEEVSVETEDEVGADLNDVPPELRDKIKPYVDKINKEFKKTYTKKFQDLSAKEKSYIEQQAKMQQDLQAYETLGRELMQNPDKIHEVRKMLYGENVPGPQGKPIGPSDIKTAQDLQNYLGGLESKIAQVTQAAQYYAEQAAAQRVDSQVRTNRWESALETLSKSEPGFDKYQKLVHNLINSDLKKYRPMYNGSNETEVLKKAYKDFKSLIREDLENVKKDTLSSVQYKKSAATHTPTKTAITHSESVQRSKEEIVERVRRKLG